MRKISLKKNAAGEYCYAMRIIDHATGRQIRYAGNTYTGNRRDAEDFAWERIRPILQARTVEECLALRMRVLAGLKSIPISEAFERAVSAGLLVNSSPKRSRGVRSQWCKFSAWIGENHARLTNMDEITPAMAQAFIDSIDVAPGTVSKYAFNLNRVFRILERDAGLTCLPFAEVVLPKRKSHGKRAFTIEQVKQILSASKSDHRALFAIGMMTGLRLKDACMLEWESVDLRHDVIEVVTAKTGAKVRVPIMQTLKITLSKLPRSERYILPDLAAMYAHDNSMVTRRNRAFLRDCGIQTNELIGGRNVPVYGFHSCRHTFAYLAGIARIPQPIVQSILGHMSPQMTELYQRHVRDEDARKALVALAEVFGG